MQIANIYIDKLNKEATFDLKADGSWKLYQSYSPDFGDDTVLLLSGSEAGSFRLNVDTDKRSYFRLQLGETSVKLAEKLLPMAGAFNFRDLGGIKNKEGRYIKWGRLFRADELTNLTDEDLIYLSSIPINSVIDFRALLESRRAPDKVPATVRYTYPIAITPGNLSNEGVQSNMLKANINTHMKQMNRTLVSDPACVRAYKTMFTIVQHKLSAPIVYHCSAGKDRTGIATALILSALDVDNETIMEDYLASSVCIAEKYAAFVAKYPKAAPIFTVKPGYLEAGLYQIKKEYKSVSNFLTQTLNVDIEKMRELYLEDY